MIAEIKGTDNKLKDEVVMRGGHLDSCHGGSGATDNAASFAIMLEAVRLLQVIGVKARRTVRIALWSGEEEGLFGSRGYVKKTFGDPQTMKLSPVPCQSSWVSLKTFSTPSFIIPTCSKESVVIMKAVSK